MFFVLADRLVECTALKRAIEIVYAATLPQASKPFVYMSIKLPSEHVDVNIHPTKREVRMTMFSYPINYYVHICGLAFSPPRNGLMMDP